MVEVTEVELARSMEEVEIPETCSPEGALRDSSRGDFAWDCLRTVEVGMNRFPVEACRAARRVVEFYNNLEVTISRDREGNERPLVRLRAALPRRRIPSMDLFPSLTGERPARRFDVLIPESDVSRFVGKLKDMIERTC